MLVRVPVVMDTRVLIYVMYIENIRWKTYVVVLDGEKHKALSILLKERLVGLLGLDCRCDAELLVRRVLLLWQVWNADDGLVNIFLVRRREVKLLCR